MDFNVQVLKKIFGFENVVYCSAENGIHMDLLVKEIVEISLNSAVID